MRRRRWLAALAALVLLPLLAAGLLLWLVDPNVLRPEIERQARERFGLPLQLRGPLRWSLWPAFSVESGEGSVGDDASNAAPGGTADSAGTSPPVSWRALRFTLQWPVWESRDWRLEGVQIEGLRLRLQQDAQGRWNVASLLRLPAPAPGSPQSPAAATTLYIDPLQLRDARIEVHVGDEPTPWIVDALQATLRVETNDAFDHWSLRELRLDSRVSGAPLASAQPLSVRTARLDYHGGQEASGARIDVEPLTAAWAGAELRLRMGSPIVFAPLSASGDIELRGESLRAALAAHRVEMPPMRAAEALARYAASSHWQLTENTLTLTALQAQLDDTHWQGTASGRWRKPMQWHVDLDGDVLDVDRYRRPASDPGEPFALPVEALRALPLSGTVRLRELRAAGSRARDARITLH
jgi:hypothetical protein